MRKQFVLAMFLTLLSMSSWAASQTVTLSVPDMTCSACPITVKLALSKVEGVSQVSVGYPDRETVVTFDDALTSIEELTEATRDAGYPSTPTASEATPEGQ
ncbi:mercury resistance system periplasmic binding protein MerP [Marinobacter nanhaiticus D15-8W]|uniref:Periplasmic mercury ion-binding protein n=1 Tax=Marinobacter nanhaiticus D15-8W TaxID=626887 RepID=N6X7S6_9GAMM|nr:mercury resistance system periplasmic binding protein MerP [Marinobacter nanhaiticus]ENO17198.1 mercury resistance system periplasmic binding protein MerP [Marinobacter nanhaiticus D15-8W]BES72064.1 mercury resistance system periplasmic binding protein MerP [Marinobacter nanhaiticus D15-8W]